MNGVIGLQLGIVIIGRNEGERLCRCLASLSGAGAPIVYVDSGSTDGSLDMPCLVGVEVVELDCSIPFSAARARNEGFARLTTVAPQVQHVQFVDGDCEIMSGWLACGLRELESRPVLAAVCGKLRERLPSASIYNRLCDLEWNKQLGEVDACGGIAIYRADHFREVGGFDASVVAGEEPELCSRLRARGWKIVRLREEMAWHDAAMLHFGQWWKRQTRGGYGGLDVVQRFDHGRASSFARQLRSARLWGLGWPAAILVAATSGWLVGNGWVAVMAVALVITLLPMQVLRLALRCWRDGADGRVAMAYGALTMIAKWASLTGQWKYVRDRRTGRHARLIEYRAECTEQVAMMASGCGR
jgi:glycosyltransferase involved in cell wall biosynthesis